MNFRQHSMNFNFSPKCSSVVKVSFSNFLGIISQLLLFSRNSTGLVLSKTLTDLDVRENFDTFNISLFINLFILKCLLI